MKRLFLFLLLLSCLTARSDARSLTGGADVSWCTEMEADGVRFYSSDGQAADIFALMKDCGMTAVRLRVWVDPEGLGYGAYCDKADVVAKAKRAHDAGLDVMIDFHYSDFFTDPGTQTAPARWQSLPIDALKAAVADHTADVLGALKAEGIEPKWVQVGNETNNGMLWPIGKIDWEKTGRERYANYVALLNAGYDAVKGVCPDVQVILHLANAYEAGKWDGWLVNDIRDAGGKFDIIGLSHYPDYDQWNSDAADAVSNANAAASVETLGRLFGVPVIVCETGFSNYDAERASAVMHDLMSRLRDIACCEGVFYWEPETDGIWKPQYYNKIGWSAYAMGAFAGGRPTAALDAFRQGDGAVTAVAADRSAAEEWFDLAGRSVTKPGKGVYIRRRGAEVEKMCR